MRSTWRIAGYSPTLFLETLGRFRTASLATCALLVCSTSHAAVFYVATDGKDANPGTENKPFATLPRAREVVRSLKGRAKGPIKVFVHGGTYYQDEPLVFGPEDSGTAEAPVIFAAFPGERVTLSGGRKLDCRWTPYQDGIMMCQLPAVKKGRLLFTQLFVNGRRQIPARFPNYDPENPLVHGRGYLNAASKVGDEVQAPHPDANDDMTFSGGAPRGIIFDAQTFTKKSWPKRHEAVIHIFQAYYWGNLQLQIKDIDWIHQIVCFCRGGW